MKHPARILAAMALLTLIATGTGSVLLLAYAVAALSCTAAIVVGTRRLVKRLQQRPTVRRPTTLTHLGRARRDHAAPRRAA